MSVQLARAEGAAPSTLSCCDNKLGGEPDWPASVNVNFTNNCKLCGLSRLLIFQCYAPLEGSPYHRTLYVFACINSNCWNKSESWSCIRAQYKEDSITNDVNIEENFSNPIDPWCINSDEWDDSVPGNSTESIENNSIDSCSLVNNDEVMEELIMSTENMTCTNLASDLKELKNLGDSQLATADIENDISDQVIVDTPAVPQCDLAAILNQKPELPNEFKKGSSANIKFISMYVNVYTEELLNGTDDHVTDLLQRYKEENEDALNFLNPFDSKKKSKPKKTTESFVDEEYEKSTPLHGDAFFHAFLNRIRLNPDQIVRYSLNGEPLLLGPLINNPRLMKCSHCSGELRFEFQILPTMIPLLQLSGYKETHLEFGNVIIYTCKKSCWREADTFAMETTILQVEP